MLMERLYCIAWQNGNPIHNWICSAQSVSSNFTNHFQLALIFPSTAYNLKMVRTLKRSRIKSSIDILWNPVHVYNCPNHLPLEPNPTSKPKRFHFRLFIILYILCFVCSFDQINYDTFVEFVEFILSMEFITSVGDCR